MIRITYIAEANISLETGMGRVAWHWKKECERRSYEFVSIDPKEVGQIAHPGLFPFTARQYYKQHVRSTSLLIVHEPAAGAFVNLKVPLILLSHGLERRAWNLYLQSEDGSMHPPSWSTKLLFPLWRLRNCDRGLRQADLLLLINSEDSAYAQKYYHRESDDIYLFKNGVNPFEIDEPQANQHPFTILFLGSWIERKGVRILVEAAQILQQRELYPRWLLAGTGLTEPSVLQDWPEELHPYLEIIPKFKANEEQSLFARSHLYVLPSFFEGQPLSLLQAMAAGKCCITTNCCGQRDLIRSGENGWLYPPDDAEKLADLIEKSLLNPAQTTDLGENAKASVQNRSWETVSAQVIDRIEALLS
jgi:glycosyltransferase involved in cell wall biosynthesis